jgi:hypothetical protein
LVLPEPWPRRTAQICSPRDISVYRLATPARGAFSVRHLLRQGVQTQTKMIDHQNGTDQNDADNHHQDIGVTRSGDEA